MKQPILLSMDPTDRVYRAGRKGHDARKLLGRSVLLLEGFAAGLALAAATLTGSQQSLAALVALLVAIISVVLKAYASSIKDAADDATRRALRSHALREPVAALSVEATERGIGWLGQLMPEPKASTATDYYQLRATNPYDRYREATAGSAFFTHDLLRIQRNLAAVAAAIVFIVAFVVIILLTTAPEFASKQAVLQGVLSTLLGFLGLRLANHAIDCARAVNQVSPLATTLCRKDVLNVEEAEDAITEYELARQSIPAPMSALYVVRLGSLEKRWRAVREEMPLR